MRKGQVVGLALCLWLTAALPAHAIVLRYAPKVGVVTKHKVTLAGRTVASMEGMPQTMGLEITGTTFYTVKALSETPDRVRLETAVTGGKVTMKIDDGSQTQDIPKAKTVVELDRRARVVEVIEADAGGGASPEDVMSAQNWANLSSFGALPEGDVKVGETWSEEAKIPTGADGPEITLNLTSRLLDLTTYQGRKCAKIRTSLKGPISFKTGDSESQSIEAMLSGQIVWYYDYENSVDVGGQGTVGMDMKMSASGPGMPGMEMTTKMLMNLKMTLMK